MFMRKHSSPMPRMLWAPLWLLLAWAAAPWPEASAATPTAKSCSKATSNWPPSGEWQAAKGDGNPGQSLYSGYTQVWTHVYKAGGNALDEIMFQLSGAAQTVSIYDSPAVPDLRGHSILGGMLRGNFTAILPNLAVCVSTPGHRDACTPICKPGHACLGQPFGAPWPAAAGGAYTINVYDIDEPSHPDREHTHLIATSRQNPAECTAERHCKWPVADKAAYGNDSTVEISFGSPCNAEQAHVIQFVSTFACAGNDCTAPTGAQQGLTGYTSTGCGGYRAFGKWYLDDGSCASPFLGPEVFCNGAHCTAPCKPGEACSNTVHGVRTVVDEPSVVLPAEAGRPSYQMQKRFVDFMMCGTEVKDVIQWTRTGIGSQPCQAPAPESSDVSIGHVLQRDVLNIKDPEPAKARVFASNYQVVNSTDVQRIKNQICNVETPAAAQPAMAHPTYQAIRRYLKCPQ
jgi:hypothetical protein